MRVRQLAVIAAVFGAAIAATAIVATQLPREGQRSPLGGAPPRARPAASPALEPAASASDGSLEVRVHAGGSPVVGAEVRLYAQVPAREPGGEPSWRRAGQGRTDARAVARIPARPGIYLAAARAPGLVGLSEAIRAAGEEVSPADVAVEPPVPLAGRVATVRGGPVARALVRAIPVASRWPSFAPATAPAEEIPVAETGPDGSFRLDGLAPGPVAVSVEARGHHPALVARADAPAEPLALALEPLGTVEGQILLPDGHPAAGAAVRAVSPDHAASATAGPDGRFTLAAPAGSYQLDASLGERAGAERRPVALGPAAVARPVEIRLGPPASVEGLVVLAATGLPVVGAEVAAFGHGTQAILARAASGGDGRFSLGGLAAGAYDVRALAPGASPALVSALTLSAGTRFPLRIALPGTGAIEGSVRDPSGRPLAGIVVRAATRGDGLLGVAPLGTRTGFDGRFRLEGLEVGRAELVARADGVLAGASLAVRVAAGRASRADLFLPEAGVLVGRVVREGGARPPLGTAVVAVPMRAGLGTLQVARAAADASGNYRLALPSGEYRIHAAPAAAPGGAPSPGAVVTVSRAGGGLAAVATSAGDDGRVLLPEDMGMAGRAVTIRARNGGRTGEATLELPRAGTVAMALAPGGGVDGVVRARGRAPAGFTLEVASQPAAGGWRTVDVHRFAGDRFELADLPAEPLRLTVRTDDGLRGEAEVRVAGGETRAVTIAVGR